MSKDAAESTAQICIKLAQILFLRGASKPASHRRSFEERSERGAALNTAVNKRLLSTGETGEFVSENVGFDLNAGVVLAPPRRLFSDWRTGPGHENLRNVGDTGTACGGRCCQ